VALTACSDVSPADWIVASALPWQRLVGFGPSGFASYARLRYLPDPAYEGQSENEADAGDDWRDSDQLATLLQVLASHTTTPGDCYVCVWEGYGDNGETPAGRGELYIDRDNNSSARTRQPARPGLAPAPPLQVPQAPQVVVPHRAYFLFHGPLADACNWGDAELWAGQTRLRAPEPAFVWPADHAWCVASDVDPHWAGIGADTHVIDQLVSDARLDVVSADPDAEQPSYQ
jgi:hypothetical protein